jgi:hypothetical protein
MRTTYIRQLKKSGIIILISVIVVALTFDVTIVSISTSIGGLGQDYIPLFVIMVLVFAVGQFWILSFAKREYNDKVLEKRIHSSRSFYLQKMLTLTQWAVLIILVYVILQMIITSSYYIFNLKIIIFISYGFALIILALLSKRFFIWFKFNHNLLVLVYGIAISILTINCAITIFYLNFGFDTETEFRKNVKGLTGSFESADTVFNLAYNLTAIFSFVFMWIATILLMRHYTRKMGKAKYWLAVGIPLAYFLSQFQPLFLFTFSELRREDPVIFGIIYDLFYTVAKPIGGILFGLAFMTISRHLSNQDVKKYMTMTAVGTMLLFAANQPDLLTLLPYPPFGLVTISFVGIASYLFYLGIYSASISVSQDSKLRQSIRNSIFKDYTNLLENVGTAQMEKELERKMVLAAKNIQRDMEKESGIQSAINDDDIKEYLNEILSELTTKKHT